MYTYHKVMLKFSQYSINAIVILLGEADGLMALFVACFVIIVWWIERWKDTTANPVSTLENWVLGRLNTTTALLVTDFFFQFSGAAVASRIIHRYFWVWGLRPIHAKKYEDYTCMSSVKGPVLEAGLVEGFGTFLCEFAANFFPLRDPEFSSYYVSFIKSSIATLAYPYSGGYFNSVMAYSVEFTCKGLSNMEHVLIYWVFPCVGGVIAITTFALPVVQRHLSRPSN